MLQIRWASRLFFAGLLVTIPLRWRYLYLERSFPPIYSDYTDVLFHASDAFLLATLLAWSVDLLKSPRRLQTGPLFLTLPVLALTALGFLNLPFSIDARLSAYHAVRFTLLAGLYFYVLNEIHALGQLIFPLALQILIQAGAGVAQVLQDASLGLVSLGELPLDPAQSGVSIVWAQGVRSLRAYGLTDHPNILGGCLAFALILLAAAFLSTDRRWPGLIFGTFSLGVLGLFFTYSRSAWLAFAVAFLLVLALLVMGRLREHSRSLVQLAGAACIITAPFLWLNAAKIGVRLNWQGSFQSVPHENQSIGERQLLQDATIRIFSLHPWSGVGLGGLPLALRQEYPVFRVDYQPAHFVLVDVAAEIGVFGALVFATLLVAPWVALLRSRGRLALSPSLVGVSGLLLAVYIVSFFDYYTWLLAPGRLWQWLAWGLWAGAYSKSLPSPSHA